MRMKRQLLGGTTALFPNVLFLFIVHLTSSRPYRDLCNWLRTSDVQQIIRNFSLRISMSGKTCLLLKFYESVVVDKELLEFYL